jgi:predicted GTPase
MNVQSSNVDKPNLLEIDKLQEQTIISLQKAKEFISNEEDLTIIDNQIKRVQELALRIAIIGPMKSGKSTLINALIGQNIMPSHGSAMTALPTDIILDSSLSEPVLTLSRSNIEKFNNLISTLKDEILEKEENGIASAKVQVGDDPRLHNLLDDIASGKFQVSPETFKVDQILQTLTQLNHLIRLSVLISNKFFQNSLDIPTIKTPFLQSVFNNSENSTGRLVIVDTPGGDEAGQNQLETMVNDQLAQASMALVIVNYRNFDNREADKIKEKVNQQFELVDINNLYIVVNQIDAMESQGHHSIETIKEIIQKKFNITQTNHIFAVSSLKALRATNLLQILQQYSDFDVNALKAMSETEKFAKTCYGDKTWKTTLYGKSNQEIKENAEELLTDSNINESVKEATNKLLNILREYPTISKVQLKTKFKAGELEKFATTYYRKTWETQLYGKTKQEIELDAKTLWEESGFAELQKAIISLQPEVEHRCLRTAIKIGIKSLYELDISWSDEFKKVKELYDQLDS